MMRTKPFKSAVLYFLLFLVLAGSVSTLFA
jgi:hypothetical protein